jgi:hypothetical protein
MEGTVSVILARNEVELINPQVSGASYNLLRSYRLRDWHDQRGNWHVVVAAQHIPEIEQAELKRRRGGDQRQYAPRYEFKTELDKALARLQARERAVQQSLSPNR